MNPQAYPAPPGLPGPYPVAQQVNQPYSVNNAGPISYAIPIAQLYPALAAIPAIPVPQNYGPW